MNYSKHHWSWLYSQNKYVTLNELKRGHQLSKKDLVPYLYHSVTFSDPVVWMTQFYIILPQQAVTLIYFKCMLTNVIFLNLWFKDKCCQCCPDVISSSDCCWKWYFLNPNILMLTLIIFKTFIMFITLTYKTN